MADPFTILNVSGPFREPRELAFSYDYAVQRPTWPTPQSVRMKIGIAEELDYLKNKVLGIGGGSPGQQLRLNQILTRRIGDRKIHIANEEGMFSQRMDVMVNPFSGPLVHLFPRLEAWMNENKDSLHREIRDTIGL
jgi:hypothetical protein